MDTYDHTTLNIDNFDLTPMTHAEALQYFLEPAPSTQPVHTYEVHMTTQGTASQELVEAVSVSEAMAEALDKFDPDMIDRVIKLDGETA